MSQVPAKSTSICLPGRKRLERALSSSSLEASLSSEVPRGTKQRQSSQQTANVATKGQKTLGPDGSGGAVGNVIEGRLGRLKEGMEKLILTFGAFQRTIVVVVLVVEVDTVTVVVVVPCANVQQNCAGPGES
mmetsp:Transcript_46257/g.122173  ORF Transcript_46257/g.122173 Transcript_46257/m.122173 type:complete len:132 (-) Transcript_46257:695-1090(-)